MKKTISIPLDSIPISASDSDATLKQKAQQYLPKALLVVGRVAGEQAWKEMQDSFRGSIIKMSNSPSEKRAFIEDIAKQFAQNATAKERLDLTEEIFTQLKDTRDKKQA